MANYSAANRYNQSTIDESFEKYALLSEKIYKEKVIDKLYQLAINNGIDMAYCFINKAFELQDIMLNNSDIHEKAIQAKFNKFI